MHFFKKVAPLLNVAGKLFLYKGFVRPTMEYSFLTWMGASESSLKQLDRVQHRVLRLIGPWVALPHLSHRRMVGALCYMYKLHCIPPSHPVASLLPGPAVAAPNPRTRRSSIARHLHQFQHDHPARTPSWNLRRFPNAASKAWNVLPPSLLQHRPELKRMQAFKNKINRHLLHSNWLAATDSLWLFPCCYLLTALLQFALYFPHSYSLILLVFSFGQFLTPVPSLFWLVFLVRSLHAGNLVAKLPSYCLSYIFFFPFLTRPDCWEAETHWSVERQGLVTTLISNIMHFYGLWFM